MPQIPVQIGPSVAPEIGPAAMKEVIPNAVMPAEAMATSLEKPIGAAEQYNDESNRRAAQATSLDIDNQLSQVQRDLLLKGSAIRGPGVLTAPDEIANEFQKQAGLITQNLQGQMLQDTAKRMVTDRAETIRSIMERHSATEWDQYKTDNFNGIINGNKDITALAAQNGDKYQIGKMLDNTTAVTQDHAFSKGYGVDDPAHKEQVRTNRSAIYTAGISGALASKNPILAQQLFDQAKADGDQTAVDLEKNTLAFKEYKTQSSTDQYTAALNFIDNNHGITPGPKTIPNWSQMTATQRDGLAKYAEAPLSTDESSWSSFMSLKPKDLADMPYDTFHAKYLVNFKESDQQKAESAWKEANGSKGQKTKEFDGIQTEGQIVANGMLRAGIPPKINPGSSMADVANEFRRQVDVGSAKYADDHNGKRPDNGALQTIVDGIVMAKNVQGSKFVANHGAAPVTQGTDHFTWKPGDSTDTSAPVTDVSQIPPGELSQINEAFTQNNITQTPENILKAYQSHHGAKQ